MSTPPAELPHPWGATSCTRKAAQHTHDTPPPGGHDTQEGVGEGWSLVTAHERATGDLLVHLPAPFLLTYDDDDAPSPAASAASSSSSTPSRAADAAPGVTSPSQASGSATHPSRSAPTKRTVVVHSQERPSTRTLTLP